MFKIIFCIPLQIYFKESGQCLFSMLTLINYVNTDSNEHCVSTLRLHLAHGLEFEGANEKKAFISKQNASTKTGIKVTVLRPQHEISLGKRIENVALETEGQFLFPLASVRYSRTVFKFTTFQLSGS